MPRCRNSATNKSRVSIISWALVVPNAIAPEPRKIPSNPPYPAETKIQKRSTLQLLECLLFSLGFYFTAKAYILLLHNKFVVAILVGVLIHQDNYKLIYPLADYIFTAGLVEGLGELISWETARAR